VALSCDLIATARQLGQLHQRRPRQADLRRAISTDSFVVAQVDEAEEALAALQRVSKPEQLDFVTLAIGFTRG
jgi:hypothetical protein